MAYFDQHLHSHHSFDCRTAPRDAVLAALDKGLAGLTFTEHFDTHPDEWPGCVYNDEAYSADIDRLRQEFGDRIAIGKGIEVCYQPAQMEFILEFLDKHSFDLVILSVHWAGGRQMGRPDHWEGLDAHSGTHLYLEAVRAAAWHCAELRARDNARRFDVLGHMDFAKRYTHRMFGEVCVDAFPEITEGILQGCLAADLIPEINTSTMRREELPDPMPGPAVMRRYAELGGEAMSFGSDAHKPEGIGSHFDRVAEMARKAGIAKLAVFKNRERMLMPLVEI